MEVSKLSNQEISRLITTPKEPLAISEKEEILVIDREFRELTKNAPAEITRAKSQGFTIWALGLRPDVFADYGYWKKFDKFSIHELVWLSTGLTPQSVTAEKELDKANRLIVLPLAEIERRRMLISRAFPLGSRTPISALEFQDWAVLVSFEGHLLFQAMLEDIVSRTSRNLYVKRNDEPIKTQDKIMQPRDFRSAAKIITAIAIDAYGYVPNQKRSPTTKDILDACDRAGLVVNKDTILKFLRAGETEIDE